MPELEGQATRIDSHQHFWDPARKDYGWLEALEGEAARRLQRRILPEELEPQLAAAQIQRTVLVQAAPTEAEGDFLLSLAEQHDFIAGTVVWLDMEAADFEQRLTLLQRRPKFCLFGSDWPVCTLAGSYAQVLGALEHALAPLALSASDQARIFGGTAAELYRLA